jgi:UDP-3-O-[3-hydroxymyristoyl] glucosamine N-acyltransferase
MYTLGDLANALALEFTGDATCAISGVANLDCAGPSDLSFISSKAFLPQLASTGAAAVILHPEHAALCSVGCLLSQTPYLSYALASQLFDDTPKLESGVHSSATVSPHADVHPSAAVGPHAVVEAGAIIAEDVIVGANSYVGHDSRVGRGCHIHSNVAIYHNVWLGEYCVIHSQATLGADGFGFAPSPDGWQKICQLGGVRIGSGVEVGASTCIDRGTLGHTVIDDGVIIDNLVQIAHNCSIGKNTAIAGCVGLAGSTIIGSNCTLAGGVGVLGHLEICDDTHVTAMSMVTKTISTPGSYSSGTPMAPTGEWKRSAVRFSQLETIHKRLSRLEKKRGK